MGRPERIVADGRAPAMRAYGCSGSISTDLATIMLRCDMNSRLGSAYSPAKSEQPLRTLEERTAQRDVLLAARFRCVRTVEIDGRRGTYVTDNETAATRAAQPPRVSIELHELMTRRAISKSSERARHFRCYSKSRQKSRAIVCNATCSEGPYPDSCSAATVPMEGRPQHQEQTFISRRSLSISLDCRSAPCRG